MACVRFLILALVASSSTARNEVSQDTAHQEYSHYADDKDRVGFLNCSGKHFAATIARWAEETVGSKAHINYHFSHEQANHGEVMAAQGAIGETSKCKELVDCGGAVEGLADVGYKGLAEYLLTGLALGSLEGDLQQQMAFGFQPVWQQQEKNRENPAMQKDGSMRVELGGGSGAGFQVFCGGDGYDGQVIATAGGGGGGGLEGNAAAGTSPPGHDDSAPSVGGGGGGGAQMILPITTNHEEDEHPWLAKNWLRFNSGGGGGCGTNSTTHHVTCGQTMDADATTSCARVRSTLLRQLMTKCLAAGRLRIAGGGGGGGGTGECCKQGMVGFGFGFDITFEPASDSSSHGKSSNLDVAGCSCQADSRPSPAGNQADASSDSFSTKAWEERKCLMPEERKRVADLVRSNFSNEHTTSGQGGDKKGGGGQAGSYDWHQYVDKSNTGGNKSNGGGYDWHQYVSGQGGGSAQGGGSGTGEPKQAQNFITQYNPIQKYLQDGSAKCGGWANFCCLCKSAKAEIQKLNKTMQKPVKFWLNTTCCSDGGSGGAGESGGDGKPSANSHQQQNIWSIVDSAPSPGTDYHGRHWHSGKNATQLPWHFTCKHEKEEETGTSLLEKPSTQPGTAPFTHAWPVVLAAVLFSSLMGIAQLVSGKRAEHRHFQQPLLG